jgi:hypothetical protein
MEMSIQILNQHDLKQFGVMPQTIFVLDTDVVMV